MKKFGTKLMVASRAVNTIPYEYLSYAQNLRIYDGGIGPRLGFEALYNANDGSNKGGFSMNGFLYQVEGGFIYRINEQGVRTQVADLGYNARVDVLVYQNTRGAFESLATETVTYSVNDPINFFHNRNNEFLWCTEYADGVSNLEIEFSYPFAQSISANPVPAIKLLQTGTPQFSGGNGLDVGDGIILTQGQFTARLGGAPLTGTFDIEVGRYASSETALIVADGQVLKVFDGEIITDTPTQSSGIIEYTAGRSFITQSNTLLASRAITLENPEYAYSFGGDNNSYEIIYNHEIKGLKATLSGLYVFTEEEVEYISDAATQNGLSVPIGDGGAPINNLCIVSSGEKIFYLTDKMEIQTVNYTSGIDNPQVGNLSSRQVVNIKEYLRNLDTEQPNAFAFNNKDENTLQFFLRTIGSDFNNVCVVYDLINDTWNIDTGRYFNYVVDHNNVYYGYSDITASVYRDCVGFNDNSTPITTKGITQAMDYNSPMQKLFSGFNTAGAISSLSSLEFGVNIDEQEVFRDILTERVNLDSGTGSHAIGDIDIGGESTVDNRTPFVRQADHGRIWMYGDRIQVEFGSDNDIQDWILDTLGIRFQPVENINIENKF